MANTIKVKQSSVPGKAPATTDLQLGELAVNTYDGKLFLKKNVSGTETIIDVTASSGSSGVSSFSAGTTGLTPSTATTGAVTLAGTLGVANGGTGATTLTGLIKGSGTSAFTAAVAGTDYVSPASYATGIATFLGSPSSANLLSAMTDETGTGLLVFNNSPALTGSPSIATGTITADSPINITQTWNNAAVTFTGLKVNVTDTASATSSLLLQLQTGGVNQFTVLKNGNLVAAAGMQLGAALNISADVYLSRRGAANWRLGAADTTGTTAPTAQTLSVQSWASSTNNNQAGANFTITGSQGTGTGAGGNIIFQLAPAGGVSGTSQNALTNVMTLWPTGQAVIGANNPAAALYNTSADSLIATSATGSSQLRLISTSATTTEGGWLVFTRTAGGSLASPTATASGATIGNILFQGYDGTTRRSGAQISAVTEGLFSGTSSPAYIAFSTTPSGSVTLTERMRLDGNGNLVIGNTTALAKLDIGPVDNADEGAEIRFRGATNATMDYFVDVYQSTLRFAKADKGAATNAAVRFQIGSAGQFGVGGANYGTSGQVLTSGGASAAPSWQTPSTAPISVTTYTSSSGTWTKPASGTLVWVRLWGAGGAGGKYGTTGGTAYNCSGGGGGGYVEGWFPLSSLNATESYSVGAGGTATTVIGAGANGGNTTFKTLTAYGGQGGIGSSSGVGVNRGSPGTLFGLGSNATNPTNPWDGGAGGVGDTNTPNKSYYGGGGGGGTGGSGWSVVSTGATSVFGGTGGDGNATAGANATNGTAPGGGGGGKNNGTGNGGAGGDGRIEIWVF